MNRSIEAIPTWSLCDIINGDASGLTDEEIRMVDEAMRKNNIEIVSPRYNEDKFKEMKSRFFGLMFTDGNIVVRMLESVSTSQIRHFRISSRMPQKANDCHNHLKLKTKAQICYFLLF